MTITYRYHVLNGSYIRQPLDLDADPPSDGLDWLHDEAWDEPPSRVMGEYKLPSLYYKRRKTQIMEIALDTRINSRSMYTRRALIDYVMKSYNVTYAIAKRLIYEARKYNATPAGAAGCGG